MGAQTQDAFHRTSYNPLLKGTPSVVQINSYQDTV